MSSDGVDAPLKAVVQLSFLKSCHYDETLIKQVEYVLSSPSFLLPSHDCRVILLRPVLRSQITTKRYPLQLVTAKTILRPVNWNYYYYLHTSSKYAEYA